MIMDSSKRQCVVFSTLESPLKELSARGWQEYNTQGEVKSGSLAGFKQCDFLQVIPDAHVYISAADVVTPSMPRT
jgi:hypothetical protein